MESILNLIILIRKFILKMNRDRVRAYAASASFFLIMSFLPFLMLLLSIIQFTPLTQEMVLEVIEELTPFEISAQIQRLVGSLFNNSYALLSWTAITAIWTSGKGIIGLADGLNSVNQQQETRNYFVIRIRAAIYAVLMLIAMVIALGILVFGYRLQQYLRNVVPLIAAYPEVTLILQLAISLVILMVLFTAFYVFLPNRPLKFKTQYPGAIFTAVAWAVFSYAFSIYLGYAVNMSVIYGGLTTLIVVMLWLYICMYLFFIGAEINRYLEEPEEFEFK
jgi:membrane protein